MNLLKISFCALVCIFFTTGCSSILKKKENSMLGGLGSSDIVDQDLAKDSKGSDAGISGLETVYFAYDSSDISDVAKEVLRSNVKWINKNTKAIRIELEGHCDLMGSEAYNIGLGLRRAQAIKSFLSSLGVSGDRFSIISYGEERPISSDYSKNRRVNFVPIY